MSGKTVLEGTLDSSQEISVDDVKKHIGISKEFSQFDYVDALAVRDAEKSFRIAYQIGRNDKNTPMVLVTSALFAHFSKIMMFHSLKDKSQSNVMRTIPGMRSPFFARKLMDSAPHYPWKKTAQIIEKLREVDARSKGVSSSNIGSVQLLKELTFFILN